MIVLDGYAVLALLKDERAAADVAALLARNDEARLTAVGVAEVVDHLVRIAGADPEEAALDLAQLGLAEALPVDTAAGVRAGLLRAARYHRKERPVSLADCVAAETARSWDGRLATSDPHLHELCHDEGIGVIPLPGSSG